MCGIVGVWYFDRERVADPAVLRAMADSIIHRGPDEDGFDVEGHVGLGMRRLSVIDLATGTQPFYSDDRSKAIVFNGEVYNFRDHRPTLERAGFRFRSNGDTEVVLRLYEQHGESFLEHLNGMFGLAIRDRSDDSLLLARDRVGIKPLYWYRDEEKLVFASEQRAILAHPGVVAELDRDILPMFLRFGFTPAPYTLLKGIRKLQPGHFLRVKGREVLEHRYWNVSYADKLTAPVSEVKEELYALLENAVDYQLVSDVPLGAFLSGGMDSSSIVHMMRERGVERISTYNIGYGAQYGVHDESADARVLARDYGTEHHEIQVGAELVGSMEHLVDHLEEPLADSSFLVTYKVAELARKTVTVILSGVGGDELFGGYRRYLGPRIQRFADMVPAAMRRHLLLPALNALPSDRSHSLWNNVRLVKAYLAASDLPPARQYGKLTSVLGAEVLAGGQADNHAADAYLESTFAACDGDDPLDRIMYFDLKSSLAEQLLLLSDKMTMAVSLEARVPYLDHRIVEFAARIPGQMKIRGTDLRFIQKESLRGRLPDYVFNRKKKGFGAPIGAWLRDGLRENVAELLGEQRLREQGIFDPDAVRTVVDDHYARVEDHTDQLLALLTFQYWHRGVLG